MASKKEERKLRRLIARYETADKIDKDTGRRYNTNPPPRRLLQMRNMTERGEAIQEAVIMRRRLLSSKHPSDVKEAGRLLNQVIKANDPFAK